MIRQLLLALALLLACSATRAQQQNFPGSGSGGSTAPAVQTGVVHLDPTCPVVATTTCYFWNADVRVYIDATTTNGNNVLTISGTDRAFTSTETLNNGTTRPWVKVGQAIFCTNGPLSPSVPIVLAQTTILSIDSATQIHTTGNAASNQTATAYCYMGDDDTANILAFWNALLANCGVFGPTTGYLSSGIAFTLTGQFNTVTTACLNAYNADYTEPSLFGSGGLSTTIMPLPNFDLTTGAGNSCQGGGQIAGGVTPPSGNRTLCFGDFFTEFSFINIWGGGFTRTTSPATNVSLFGANARLNTNSFQGWMAQVPTGATTMYGVVLNGNQVRFAQGCACYFGEYSLVMNAQAYQIGNFAQGGIFSVAVFPGVNSVNPAASYTSAIGPSSGSASGCVVIVITNAQFAEYGDHITGATGNIAAHCVQAGAIGSLNSSTISMTGSGGTIFSGLGAVARTQVQNTSITGNGTATLVNMASGGIFDDQGGNLFTTFGTGFTGAGSVARTDSAMGNVCATGNWGLTSGWGASSIASVGANGNSHKCKVSITGAAGSASPVLTWTFPQIYPIVAPSSCSILQVGGTFAVLTNAVAGTPSTTAVTFTFAGTPAANTYIFEATCGP